MISVGHRNFHLTYRIVVFDMLYSLDVLKFLKNAILCCSFSELTTFICCIFMWKCLDLTWLGVSISNIYLRLSRLPLNLVCTAAIFVCMCLMWGSQDIKMLLDRQAVTHSNSKASSCFWIKHLWDTYCITHSLSLVTPAARVMSASCVIGVTMMCPG